MEDPFKRFGLLNDQHGGCMKRSSVKQKQGDEDMAVDKTEDKLFVIYRKRVSTQLKVYR